MKNFMLFIASVVTALLPEPAFTQNSEKTSQASATPCSLPSQASTIKAYKPRLLPGNSENASALEVEDKKNTTRRFTWNFVASDGDASVACFGGKMIALQIMPADVRCLLSVRNVTTPDRNLPTSAVEKLICE